MRTRAGIGVARDAVAVVVLRGAEVLWSGRSGIDAGAGPEGVRTAVAELLRSLPVRRRRRSIRVTAAVGPGASQVKHLRSLPPLEDPALIRAAVEENLPRFFLRNGAPLRPVGVRPLAPGEAWAAVIEEPVSEAIEGACADAGLRLCAITAAAVALPFALDEPEIRCTDGRVALEVRHEGGRLTSVRRFLAPAPATEAGSETGSAETHCDPPAVDLAAGAALGAARLPDTEVLALRLGRGGWTDPRVRRTLPPAVALGVALLALLLAPLGSARIARSASGELEALSDKRRIVAGAEAELGRVSATLDEIDAFARERRSSVAALAELTRALPPDCAFLDLQLDSAGGSAVALAPRAATVLSALDRLPMLVGVELVGPVTRENAGGRDLERASFHFRLAQPSGEVREAAPRAARQARAESR